MFYQVSYFSSFSAGTQHLRHDWGIAYYRDTLTIFSSKLWYFYLTSITPHCNLEEHGLNDIHIISFTSAYRACTKVDEPSEVSGHYTELTQVAPLLTMVEIVIGDSVVILSGGSFLLHPFFHSITRGRDFIFYCWLSPIVYISGRVSSPTPCSAWEIATSWAHRDTSTPVFTWRYLPSWCSFMG